MEQEEGSFGAYSPDVPNVYALGSTVDEVLSNFRLGLEKLFQLIRDEGGDFPVPRMIAVMVEIEGVA